MPLNGVMKTGLFLDESLDKLYLLNDGTFGTIKNLDEKFYYCLLWKDEVLNMRELWQKEKKTGNDMLYFMDRCKEMSEREYIKRVNEFNKKILEASKNCKKNDYLNSTTSLFQVITIQL